MRPFYLPLLAVAALLVGCHKDQEAPEAVAFDTSGRYHAGPTILATNPITMYTRSGAVTNPTVVDRYLARRPWAADFFSRTDANPGNAVSLTLTFRSLNRATVTVTGPNNYLDSVRADVSVAADYLVLKQLDTLSALLPLNTSCMSRAGQLSEALRQLQDDKTCVALPAVTGYSQSCKVRAVRQLKSRAGQPYIPLLSTLVQTGTCQTAVSNQWNSLSTAPLSQLAAGDTVLVQERELPLLR